LKKPDLSYVVADYRLYQIGASLLKRGLRVEDVQLESDAASETVLAQFESRSAGPGHSSSAGANTSSSSIGM